ncbi:MAG: hypothetical protein IT223_10350 [Crocinitomicaceae bacterium]|nr:hypothetical protein [Crocinitomicaceae bacterium]
MYSCFYEGKDIETLITVIKNDFFPADIGDHLNLCRWRGEGDSPTTIEIIEAASHQN